MEVLIVNSAEVLRDISTTHDMLVNSKCDFYGRVEIEGNLCISDTSVFHQDVKCRSLVVMDGSTPLAFKKNLKCHSIQTDLGLLVLGTLDVAETITYDGKTLKCGELIVNGVPMKIPPGERVIGEENKDLAVVSEPSPLVSWGVCEECHEEKGVNLLHGHADRTLAVCVDCSDALILSKGQYEIERAPFDWEFQFFSEEEREFYLRHKYVDFPIKFPDKPFIHIYQDSQDGELTSKELVVFDPESKYLTDEDVQYYYKKISYNGGPVACMLQGIGTAGVASALLYLMPVIGPVAAGISFACSLPLTWKASKGAANWINDNILLPHEIELRKELIEGRKKDEEIRQKSDIVIL